MLELRRLIAANPNVQAAADSCTARNKLWLEAPSYKWLHGRRLDSWCTMSECNGVNPDQSPVVTHILTGARKPANIH